MHACTRAHDTHTSGMYMGLIKIVASIAAEMISGQSHDAHASVCVGVRLGGTPLQICP